jgi:hypothetical protein
VASLVKDSPVSADVLRWLGREALATCECGAGIWSEPYHRSSYATPEGVVEVPCCDRCYEQYEHERDAMRQTNGW